MLALIGTQADVTFSNYLERRPPLATDDPPTKRRKLTLCWGDWSKGVVTAQWVGVNQSNAVGGGGQIIVTFVT